MLFCEKKTKSNNCCIRRNTHLGCPPEPVFIVLKYSQRKSSAELMKYKKEGRFKTEINDQEKACINENIKNLKVY